MRDVVDRTIGVIDETGSVIACSDLGRIGEVRTNNLVSIFSSNTAVAVDGCLYQAFGTHMHPEYAVFVEGDDTAAQSYIGVLGVSLLNIKQYYDEKYDRSNFIKNIILDNILPNDIYVKSNELHMANDEHRVVIVVKFQSVTELSAYEIIQNVLSENSKDYVINISEQDIVIVREISEECTIEELEESAHKLIEQVADEYSAKILIGISPIVEKLKDLAKAYKEARIALEVGKVFDIERPVISYENLGIGRLIYQLPTTLCDIFLQEVFKKGSLESLDRETLMTVQSFFENNLNVSETSRKLFVHRNTLVYRLEKIRKLTGLDLREFDHAVTFKVALMVKKYLSGKPAKF